MRQGLATFQMRRYRLQPDDGTCYEFFICPLESITLARCVDTDEPRNEDGWCPEEVMKVWDVVTGVSPGISNFVSLGICSPGQGVYEVPKSSLRDPIGPFVGYLHGHMPGVLPYTLAAVVLACSVLVDRPAALEDACEAMLKAPELLRGRGGLTHE